MQIPILSGIYAAGNTFRTAYPVNLVPVPKTTGVSEGFLRVAQGIVQTGDGVGACRAGVEWNGVEYRVLGSSLCRIDRAGAAAVIGDVGAGGAASFAISFDYLAVCSDQRLFFYDGSALREVVDDDLGAVDDVTWIDGYFATTDGQYIVVTELSDPFAVDPLKYGSSEVDPDRVMRVLNVHNELTAVNRHTVETFYNAGGEGFPFARNRGAHVTKGAIGSRAACVFRDAVALLGGGRNDPPSVWVCANGSAVKLATAEIETILSGYSESVLSLAIVEAARGDGHDVLYLHLPDQTLSYDAAATEALGSPVWYILRGPEGVYNGRHRVWAYDRCNVAGESGQRGYLSDDTAEHFGALTAWEITTPFSFNEARGMIVHETELVGAFAGGRVGLQYSRDGEEWSQHRWVSSGGVGARQYRPRWLGGTYASVMRAMRFTGYSDTRASIARCEIRAEALAW